MEKLRRSIQTLEVCLLSFLLKLKLNLVNTLTKILCFHLILYAFIKGVQNVVESMFLDTAFLPSCVLTHSLPKCRYVILFNQSILEISNYLIRILTIFIRMNNTTLYVLQPRIKFLPLRCQRMQRTCIWIWSFEIHSNVWRYHQIPSWLLLNLRSFWNSLTSSFILFK